MHTDHDSFPVQERSTLAFAAAPEGNDGATFEIDDDGYFGVEPFKIPCGNHDISRGGFALSAPSTKTNAARIMRAMQLSKPILLEGSPGVGKTSIISALAAASGHKLVRLNLSEQTDMMDLLGADLPAAGGAAGEFVWSDGAFLAALKAGDWVLLDELNLAPQPVLEGLNAVLDHRAEVFVPELGQTFRCPPTFRVFAAQNPVQEGGGRKGLPKSFLNRFTRVHVEPMCSGDLHHISRALHPGIPDESVSAMVRFNASLAHAASAPGSTFARAGSPWEFNLRDILRWCDLAERSTTLSPAVAVERLFGTLFLQRLRTYEDRAHCGELFEDAFGYAPHPAVERRVFVSGKELCIGDARIACGDTKMFDAADSQYSLIPGQFDALEAVAHCVQRGWMSILVGASASGKTTIVQMLAALSGNRLRQAALTAATDTSELLGSFEQRDPSRDRAKVEEDIFSALQKRCSVGSTWTDVDAVERVWTLWERYTRVIRTSVDMSGGDSYAALMDVLKALNDIDGGARSIALKESVESVGQSAWAPGPSPDAGKFEWVDGVLLNAVINGEWVLLENANLCSPTVLDRLNPLLEPEGFLLVNECGLINGEPRVVKAHPNFRLFLAIDPRHGEVSRAMRNRGVEVFLLPSRDVVEDAPDATLPDPLLTPPATPTADDDASKVLESVGVPGGFIRNIMIDAHAGLVKSASRPGARGASARQAAEWATLATELLCRGHDAQAAMLASWSQVYMRGEANADLRQAAFDAFENACSRAFASLRRIAAGEHDGTDAHARSVMFQPMCWPNASVTNDSLNYNAYDDESRHRSQTALFEGIVAQVMGQIARDAAVRDASPLVAGALPVAAAMRRVGFDAAVVRAFEDEELRVSSLVSALHASAHSLIDGALMNDDARHVVGIVTRLSAFVELGAVESVPAVRDEVAGVVRALALVQEHPYGTSPRADDSALRALVAKGVAHKTKTEIHARRSANAVSVGAASCLQLSVWRGSDSAERARAIPVHPCVDVAGVLLGTCAAFEDAYLRLLCAAMEPLSSYATVTEFQNWRLRLEDLLKTTSGAALKMDPTTGLVASADVLESIAVVWTKVREALASLLADESLDTDSIKLAVEQLRHAGALMDSALEIPDGKPIDPLLWKYAGRPSLPKTRHLFESETNVRDICDALRIRSTFSSDLVRALTKKRFGGENSANDATFAAACAALGAGVELRSAALEGLCFFAWTHIDSNDAASVDAQMEREAEEIPRLLGKKCEDRAKSSGVRVDVSVESMEDAEATLRELRHISDLPANELLKSIDAGEPWRLGAIGDVSVPAYPTLVFPAWSMKWETVSRLNAALLPIAELWSVASQSKLLSRLTSRLMFERRGPAMDASEAALAAQDITFGIVASPRSPADFAAHRQLLWLYGDAQDVDILEPSRGAGEHLHDMWVRWHASQWNNAMDGVPTSLLPKTKRDSTVESPVPALWTSASGPVRFERATATVFAAAIAHDTDVGCAERVPRMAQLRMASRLLRFERDDPVRASREDWLSLASLFAQVLLCHKTLLDDDASRANGLLDAVDVLIELVREPSSMKAKSAMTKLGAACASLCEAYPPLEASRAAALEPLARAVCEGASHRDVLKAASLSGESAARDRGRRGTAWALLGVLRLNLLLPAGVSDPAVIVRVECWHLDATLSREVEPLAGVLTWQQRTPSAPAIDEDSVRACERRRVEIVEKRETLRALSLPRPTPSRWDALRRDVSQFRDGLASAHRLLSILDRCSALDFDESAVMEAETWLGSSEQWISRLDEEYAEYRDMTQPLQLAVYEIRRGLALAADAARARAKTKSELVTAAVALFSFPTVVSSSFEGSAALALSEDRVLRALSVAENVATAHLAFNPKSGDLEVGALRVALTSAFSEARRDGALSAKSWKRLRKCFAAFAALYESCREEDAEAERLATEVFKQATKGPSSYEAAEGNDEETEERAYRIAFKDFASEYADFKDAPDAPLSLEHDCVEENQKEEDEEDDDADVTRAARMAGILEGELAEELVNVHYAALATLRGAPSRAFADESTSAQEKIVQSTRLEKYGKYVRHLTTEESLRASEFARAYDVGVSVLKASQLSLPVSVDYASRLGHSLRVALEHSAVSKSALSVETLSSSSRDDAESATQTSKRTRAELDEDAAADALDAELTVGGCPGEMALLVPPVAAIRRRLTTLLEEWPEHPLLTQLTQICDRMLALPLLGPVKSGLTGIELLLARAQIWEESAAAHTSLRNELSECAKLALRWRAREVRTWPRLLARCSERHASRAKRTWFALRRLLSSMKSRALVGADAEVGDQLDDKLDMEKIRNVTMALEEYLQGSTIGEFDARLELVWCFYAEMDVEMRACIARGDVASKRDAALRAILYNVWRYYAQFQPVVEAHVESIRKPCETKLRDHAKLAKWEDRGYHAMKVQGEANQRSLHKFVRAFDTGLNGLALPILESAASRTGFKEMTTDGGVGTAAPTSTKEELEVARAVREAEADVAREAELDLLKSRRASWRESCDEATSRTKSATERASIIAGTLREEFIRAGVDADETSYAARLPALVERAGAILDRALNEEEGHDVRTAGAESLDDFATTIARRASALREDKVAKKAIKKKALQDLLKALPAMGVKHSRAAVPVEYREATSWFTEQPMERPRDVDRLGPNASDALASADAYYYRSMARVQRLWRVRSEHNPDLTSREVEIATRSCEHLLHIIRCQRATITAAVTAETELELARDALGAMTRASDAIPAQRFTELWLIEQRHLIDRFDAARVDVALLNKTVSAAEPLAEVKTMTSVVVDALASCKEAARLARERLDPFIASTLERADVRVGNERDSEEPWRLNVIASEDASRAIRENFDALTKIAIVLSEAQRRVEKRAADATVAMCGANVVPGWDFLRSIVDDDVARYAKDFNAGVSPVEDARVKTDAATVDSVTTRLESLRRGIEDVVRSALLWVQGVNAASKPITVKREIVPEGEDEEEEVDGTMLTYEAASGGAVAPDRLDRIAHAARDVVREVKAIIDDSHALGDVAVARFVAARVGEIAPLLGVLSAATRVVLGEYVAFHKSSCKLESVLTALFLGLCAEGFCAPPEEVDGEGGGGMMDDQSGTGMGAGEGKKDVADEIENEDQILGMEDLEKQDEDEKKDKNNTGDEEDDGGIEMQNDFEGTMEDVDAGGEDDDDQDDAKEDMEKEMGDDGDDGDVIDERMWNDEDDDANEDEKNQAPEKYEKGSSVKQDDAQETETRAKDEDDADDAPPKDPEGDDADARDDAEDKDDRKNDPSAANDDDDDGKLNDEEIEENHGFDPSKPEPEELELDDDVAMDEDEDDGDEANEDESMRDEDAEGAEGEAPEDAPAEDANENAAEGETKDDGDGGLTEDVMDVDEEDKNGEENDDELATDNLNDDAAVGDDAMNENGDQGGPQGQGSGSGGDHDVDDAQGQGGEAGASARGSEGLGEEDTKQKPNADVDGDEEAANDASQLPPPQSSADAASAGADGEGTGGGASGGEGTVAPSAGGGAGDYDARPPPPQRQQDANPHRSLGDALKNWRERLNVVGDAAEETNAEEGGGADAGAEGNEYEFERNADDGATGDENADGEGGMQTLANATEEQALRHNMNDRPDDDDDGGEDVERAEMREDDRAALPEDGDEGPGDEDVADDEDDVAASSKQRKKQSSGPKKESAPTPADARAAALEGEDAVEDEEMDDELVAGGEGETGEESTIALQLENTSLGSSNDVKRELTAEDVERARAEAERSLTEWREKSSAGDEAKAQDLWRKLEQLTTALSAELAEKLRLILEPTLASRLQGDYKTGKRLNMRKIIPYIASDFRKDKIWLRRSRPSSRKYQVMLAIDDSRSMAENHCGHIALESMVLLARAMARLEVGEIGVVGFGAGANAVRTLHPLGAPFTDQEGPSLVSKLSFAEDNTLADRPMVQLLETMAARLNVAREQIRGGGTKLQQLVLIIADGRFHEKEALRRCMREMGAQRGLLVAFIVLDNPKNSLLNMQSVSFTNGKPVMKKYLDSFPFPFYVLVQDVSQLPATISDLLRQWFEMAASHD